MLLQRDFTEAALRLRVENITRDEYHDRVGRGDELFDVQRRGLNAHALPTGEAMRGSIDGLEIVAESGEVTLRAGWADVGRAASALRVGLSASALGVGLDAGVLLAVSPRGWALVGGHYSAVVLRPDLTPHGRADFADLIDASVPDPDPHPDPEGRGRQAEFGQLPPCRCLPTGNYLSDFGEERRRAIYHANEGSFWVTFYIHWAGGIPAGHPTFRVPAGQGSVAGPRPGGQGKAPFRFHNYFRVALESL